jgi:hypothetical protein
MNAAWLLEEAAGKAGWTVEELLSWKVYPDHVVVIGPTGQKFCVPLEELGEERGRTTPKRIGRGRARTRAEFAGEKR